MSDLTVIQLVVAQRERELRAETRWDRWDLLLVPLAGVFALAAVPCLFVGVIVTVVLSLWGKSPDRKAEDGANSERIRS